MRLKRDPPLKSLWYLNQLACVVFLPVRRCTCWPSSPPRMCHLLQVSLSAAASSCCLIFYPSLHRPLTPGTKGAGNPSTLMTPHSGCRAALEASSVVAAAFCELKTHFHSEWCVWRSHRGHGYSYLTSNHGWSLVLWLFDSRVTWFRMLNHLIVCP